MAFNPNDIVVGYDPTGTTSITGAQLAQLVNSANPNTDRGFIIVSTDVGLIPVVPDGVNNPKFQRYIWLRISTGAVNLYVWNPAIAPSNTFQNWQNISYASIGQYTITGGIGGNIQLNSITPDNISSIQGSQIVGALSATASANLLTNATAFGGVLSGLYNALSFVLGTGPIGLLKVDAGDINKPVPVGADIIPVFDSASANVAKYSTISQILNNNLFGATTSFKTPLSAALTATATGVSVIAATAHGLINPIRAQAYLYCATADNNFGVGDTIIAPTMTTGTTAGGITVGFNGTNVWANAYNTNSIRVVHYTGSAYSNDPITPGSWKMYVIVYTY